MKQLLERVLENLSTRDVFRFRIRCQACGRDYADKSRRFSKAGITPDTRERRILFDALYSQELLAARHSALQEAKEHINYCPICQRLVCNHCFLICEDLDMCRACAAHLKETGTPVDPDVLESAV